MPDASTIHPRLDSIDRLRGLVMVLMALDHARDFFHEASFSIDPTDLTRATPFLFLVRWVTHFCAPVFVFLAGTSAYLSMSRGKSKTQLTRMLLSRGLFLIVLDPTVIHFSWMWDTDWHFNFLQVIWVLGWSMVVLAGLIHFPRWFVAAFAIVTTAGHNLLDGIAPDQFGRWSFVWNLLHVQGITQPIEGFHIFVAYPLIPWVGVLAAGYAFAPIMNLEAPIRRRRLIAMGAAMTLGFVVIRGINRYGDPNPWSAPPGQLLSIQSLLSLLNCQKYPPSLSFLLMTLGPAILALAWFERPAKAMGRCLVVFGRVPMFFYLIHAPLLHLISSVASLVYYGPSHWNINILNPPEVYGFGWPAVFAGWAIVVIGLYFPCRWFASVKQRRRDWWLSYL